jgi:hypothetical protein
MTLKDAMKKGWPRSPQEKKKKKNVVKVAKRTLFENELTSNSDISEEICSDSMEIESELDDFDESTYFVDDFVVVKCATKKTLTHYVGQIKIIKGNDYSLSFMKRLTGKSNQFIFPEELDEDKVDKMDIVLKLPPPHISGTTTRASCQFTFCTFCTDLLQFKGIL